MLTKQIVIPLIAALILGIGPISDISGAAPEEEERFKQLTTQSWQQVFSDSCTNNWRDQWFLDGIKANVTNDAEKMTIDTAKGYAVLWTKPEFEGDLKIEYDFRRADRSSKNAVNIIYIQARGDAQNGHTEDITQWSERRSLAAMRDYFQNMHTYHVSYATAQNDYVRGRRYLPLANKGLKGTKLAGEYTDAGVFRDKQWVHVTLIKRDKEIWVAFKHPDKTLLCHFTNTDKPAINAGRIGLRLMPGRESHFKNFSVSTPSAKKPIPTKGWRCHIIQPDPKNHGPDGINVHDWDGDGDLDVFANFEEGKYSRLYFNPGKDTVREEWTDYIEVRHGKCEDSSIGDLDNDGDIDYVANGGHIYFNPGKEKVRNASDWVKMTLFEKEQRVPTVIDIDGDGLNDLVVGAQTWYKQPKQDKHIAKNWRAFSIGKTVWPMNCLPHDVDQDGDFDLVVPDRRKELFWYENMGKETIGQPWPRHQLHPFNGSMFMDIGDVNLDGIDDFAFAGGYQGKAPHVKKLVVLIRTNKSGAPTYDEVLIEQPCGNFPKGIKIMDIDGDPSTMEIVVTPKQGDLWYASYSGDPKTAANWTTTPLGSQKPESRKKMDNIYVGDLDGDGDPDLLTTEENSAWGVIWFENPNE